MSFFLVSTLSIKKKIQVYFISVRYGLFAFLCIVPLWPEWTTWEPCAKTTYCLLHGGCFKGDAGKYSSTGDVMECIHVGFSKGIDTIVNWTAVHDTSRASQCVWKELMNYNNKKILNFMDSWNFFCLLYFAQPCNWSGQFFLRGSLKFCWKRLKW